MLLCRYGPLPHQTLLGSHLLTSQARLRKIAHRLNALPTFPRVPIACPADNGAKIVIYVMYRKAPTRIVDLELNGCMIASRGSVLRWDAPAPDHGHLFRWLTRLTS